KSGSTVLTVTPAVLRSLVVSPQNVHVAKGLTTQLTATGTYSDHSTQDLTHSATWQSDHPSTASVDTWGLVTSAQQGTATVTATSSTLSASSAVTVDPAVITAIVVSPAAPSVPAGDPKQFTATATLSDGSTSDVSSLATWASDTPAVATVDTHGLASTLKQGTAHISASYSGLSDSKPL